ncbi:MAG: DUF92 domain-containing protein [Chloroflexi bacterium HGW-Chloroflexi-10]|nr:MAG: DUF92 domain-containing protein [Chloroflexi bacterium HGW-Chloroflexi-10]
MVLNSVQVLIGLLLALMVAYIAYRVRTLSRSGAIAAAALGWLVFGFGGFEWAVLLLTFFISSSGLSRLRKRRKAKLEEKFSKSSTRDAGQVLANGGVAGFFVLLHIFFPAAFWPWLGFAGALAAANADTWATELGVLSRKAPVSMVTWKRVERGTSGGITVLGTLSAALGAGLIGVLAVLCWPTQISNPMAAMSWLPVVGLILAGLLGSLVDSFLGATVQAMFVCPKCKKETERYPLHLCGTKTNFLRGWRWLDNDWVNGLCTLVGGLVIVLSIL